MPSVDQNYVSYLKSQPEKAKKAQDDTRSALDAMAVTLWLRFEKCVARQSYDAQVQLDNFRAVLTNDWFYAFSWADRGFKAAGMLRACVLVTERLTGARAAGPVGYTSLQTLHEALTGEVISAAGDASKRSTAQCSDLLSAYILESMSILLKWLQHDMQTMEEFAAGMRQAPGPR
jgi:hypothetical protein